jgi:hypothetical protein
MSANDVLFAILSISVCLSNCAYMCYHCFDERRNDGDNVVDDDRHTALLLHNIEESTLPAGSSFATN